MSILIRRIYLVLTGLIAGTAVWPAIEIILRNQEQMNSYFLLSVISGMIFGSFIGAFFGTINGIVLRNRNRILKGAVSGMAGGALAGILGFLVSQGVLFIIGQYLLQNMRSFHSIGLPVSRALGWAVMGVFIGTVEGIRAGSVTKVKIGILGGFLGGLSGGFVLEYLVYLWPHIVIARFTGLLVFGVMLGFFYGLVESRMSYGRLTLLNGKYKGKEFIINQRSLRIGKKKSNDIVLSDYRHILNDHARLKVLKDELFIKPGALNGKVLVNDVQVNDHKLIRDDVIQIGNAKLIYRF